MTNEPVSFDEGAIARLRDIGGQQLVYQLLESFLLKTPPRLAAARQGVQDGDMDMVTRAAHSLKSSTSNVGATAMFALTSRLEQEAFYKHSAALPDLVRQLGEAFESVRPLLEAAFKGAAERPRIAVVEDNADNRLLVRAMLADDYDVSEYESGPEALAGVRSLRPAVILLDVSLPGMDGLDVLARLRADEATKGIPAIALTAHAMEGDREKYLTAGFNDYVAKPIIDENVLRKAITSLLAR
jgi:two-component system cell cycle response regulator DivK